MGIPIQPRARHTLDMLARTFGPLWLGCGLWLAPQVLPADPGPLAQVPLFLTTGVQPNIFFLLDDSGSMDYEVLKTDGARLAHPNESTFPNKYNVDFSPNDTAERLELCAGYNALAYNPDATYTPWKGKDRYGDAFTDQNPSLAQVNPYTGSGSNSSCFSWGKVNNVNGRKCNLLSGINSGNGVYYYVWNDANGNGVYENGECPTNSGSRVYVSSLSTAERTNYANWFSYYRKREYVLKRALSEIIEASRERMGLGTINRRNHVTAGREVGTAVRDIDDISLPLDTDAEANKALLMDNLLGINSSGSTPLRIGLKRVGDYFGGASPNALFGYTPSVDPDSASGYSPILNASLGGECQQNFAVVMSDGFWNGSTSPGVGNTDGPQPDGDGDSPYDGQSYADGYGNTLADVAMKYYEDDLISDLANKVPEVSILAGTDDNPAQHLVTFTVAFGINGNVSCDPSDRAASVESQGWPNSCDSQSLALGWPQPGANQVTTVDDMRHAAWNGRGQFLNAKDPEGLIAQLTAAITDIGTRTATAAAAVSVNTSNIQVGGLVYQAAFDSTLWGGELNAYDLMSSGLGAPAWQAHTLLNGRDLGDDPRVMITFDGSNGIPFRFPVDYRNPQSGELTTGQIEDLLFYAPHKAGTPWNSDSITSGEITANQTYGEDLVAYFRGSRAKEGRETGDFRERSGLLADIIHSAPVFVGDPDPKTYPDNIEGTDSYQTWANVDAHGRTPVVYLGTNGGALHGFNAATGREILSYFPKLVFSDDASAGLHLLAQQNYSHRYYVDQTPTVAEVNIDSGDGQGKKWHTVLVGGLRGGGKGLFALDVSDPTQFSDEATAASMVLWEFTHNDLGFTFSKPTLAKMKDGKWAAVFGNGYNADPNGDGRAKLFIVYLDGSNLSSPIILDTQAGSISNNSCSDPDSDCNGMATPAVIDMNGDGIADRAYAGDLKGNMWAFDLSDSDPSAWGSAYLSGATPQPLFTARDSDGNVQPITSQPAVTLHLTKKDLATEPNTLVFFGTGQFLVASDSQTAGEQSFYGIWDAGAPISGRSDLQQQTITQSTHSIGDEDFEVRVLSNHNVNYELQKGWYIDLPESGERVISNPLLFGELIIYTTITPHSTQCQGAGSSWLMVHGFFNGGEPDFIALDVDNNGAWDTDDVSDGHNISGVRSGDLLWDPMIVQSGAGNEGTVLLPKDSGATGGSLTTQKVRGGDNQPYRSSWTRFR